MNENSKQLRNDSTNIEFLFWDLSSIAICVIAERLNDIINGLFSLKTHKPQNTEIQFLEGFRLQDISVN